MNLESKVNEHLWQTIKSSYEGRNYTAAIKDAIYFLGDTIREKTDLQSDGVSLVGQAFGGKSPKLKVNKLQSESDKNIQSGIAQILRGIYQAIRNPRSHEKYNDSELDADSIILFIDYLLKIIGQAKSPFTMTEFIARIFDEDFVAKSRYAELLVKEIPKKQRLEVFFEVYKSKLQGDGTKLGIFMRELLDSLEKDELSTVYETISDELKITDDEKSIRMILQIFPINFLEKYDEIARLRLENKLIDSIKRGMYDSINNKCIGGALGTWAASRCEYFLLKDDLAFALIDLLSTDYGFHHDYVFNYFLYSLMKLQNPPCSRLVSIIKGHLNAGNKKFLDALIFVDEEWTRPFQEELNTFSEADPVDNDDIPF